MKSSHSDASYSTAMIFSLAANTDIRSGAPVVTITLTGKADGTTVSQSFVSSIDNRSSTSDFTTRTLTNFTNLTSFNIQQTSGRYYASVDNINLSAVPEPSTWAMLGLAFVAGSLRRKKSA